MLIELGLSGYISFRNNVEIGRLIVLCPTDTLDPIVAKGSMEKVSSLEPIGHYGDSDPMKMPVPGFCLHPFKVPTAIESGFSEWTWFASTPDDGLWQVCLAQGMRAGKVYWGCQFSFFQNAEYEEASIITHCELLDYSPETIQEDGQKFKLSLIN